MKIYSMTATFGKLSQQTLTFDAGLNIIEAPNEWGKSTWCAFLMAMLYGIDTGARAKAGFLPDKEHYAPWSGQPMSGRMDICWSGRDITIERKSKGRTPMGEVSAYETHTGIPVPELSVAMPGQVLLGVERSVFARAGFLRLSEMPVTEDESLRRRLNELVTTADESGAADDLAQKLRDLKNRCRFNKKGLLPEAETKLAETERNLQQMEALEYQISSITARQRELEEDTRLLKNHKQALEYEKHLQYAQRLAGAQLQKDVAADALKQAEQACQNLPGEEKIRQAMTDLQQLRDRRDVLHTKAQLLPPLPQPPVSPEVFRGKRPEDAEKEAALYRKTLAQLKQDLKKPVPLILGGALILLGVVLALLSRNLPGLIGAGVLALCGIILLITGAGKQKKIKAQIAQIKEQYRGIPEENWESMARDYAKTQQDYNDLLRARQTELEELNRQLEENGTAIVAITGEQPPAQFEELCRQQLLTYSRLDEQKRAYEQAQQVLSALSQAGEQTQPPQFADTLTLSVHETEEQLTELALERQQLHQRLGQCQGQMESLGQKANLEAEKQQLQTRIAALEQHYNALVRAQEILLQANRELQRRFAPRISQRAQELFARLTAGRYQRITLGQDMSLEAATQSETTLRNTLWRSDGTVDQLYLALRLAVAEELTPHAPLVLDDALVRFDDVRLKAALEILEEVSADKQVILFTCQGREQAIQGKETL
ncbi:MAG: AAA family ATPase [Oscillospiraceae bacterium]|nr:AAA family ATPase [Oscillospiraceae bacterium]